MIKTWADCRRLIMFMVLMVNGDDRRGDDDDDGDDEDRGRLSPVRGFNSQ